MGLPLVRRAIGASKVPGGVNARRPDVSVPQKKNHKKKFPMRISLVAGVTWLCVRVSL